MKIIGLKIINFRAIKCAEVADLGELVVIAGPNGSGKSCILDAIRLVKSIYGSYQADEWSLWMGEFQINTNPEQWELKKLLRNSEMPAEIKLHVTISQTEAEYLREKQDTLMEEAAFRALFPAQRIEEWRRLKREGSPINPDVRSAIDIQKQQFIKQLDRELNNCSHTAWMKVDQAGKIIRGDSLVLQTVWRTYQPSLVGVIDYHGSHRKYAREEIGGINVRLKSQEELQRQHSLYNYEHKYTNIKTEMATEFLQDILRKESGISSRQHQQQGLEATLKELFDTFFPGKRFEGAKADTDGSLKFPVQVDNAEHDINELSSGEKEILYGYLRLRRSAPKDSVILLDEPELHLNPKLIQGLPQFYQQHLVHVLNNQMWLITHSDALLRESLTVSGVTVLHMQEAKPTMPSQNQLKPVEEHKDEEHLIMELVGDIAGYRPGGKVVIFEGNSDGFDVKMTARLFPEYDRQMNFIGGHNKQGVERLHRCLEKAKGTDTIRVYSIVDRDWHEAIRQGRRKFSWDVYHIENYLLDETYIYEVLKDLTVGELTFKNPSAVEEELRKIARGQIESLISVQLQSYVNNALVSKIKISAQSENNLSSALRQQAVDSVQKIKNVVEQELTEGGLRSEIERHKIDLGEALTTDKWKRVFKGRDVLAEFANRHCNGVRTARFRDMIVNRMRQRGYQPSGMRNILRKIHEE